MSPDRNLLFGILAVQMNFISRDALIVAMNAWVLTKHRPLADILQKQGKLLKDRAELLNALVAEHLKTHDNDPQKSLAALSSVRPIQAALQAVADPDVQQSVGLLRADKPTDPYETVSRPAHVEPLASTRFRILRPHARGGLGEVYVAEDTELHREVALKEIQNHHADNQESRGRFVFEAEITGGLEHPNIVPVYGLGTYADGRPYYAMRFIRGDSLQDAIKRFHGKAQGRTSLGFDSLQFRNLLKRFVDVCNAIAYAHSRGILHRDLKPGNIMLGKYGETLVVDWGLAKPVGRAELRKQPDDVDEERVLHPVSGDSFDQTLAGTAIGTPGFMSPEQSEGRLDELGLESDVYSLGATLYVLLTGKAPFNGEFVEVQRKVIAGDFLAPRSVNRQVPAPLNAVVLKAMARRKLDRYVTATDLAEEIEHYLADEPVAAYREPVAARTKRWMRKHPGIVSGIAATVLVGIIGLSAGLYFVNAEKNRTETARQNEETQKRKAEENERQALIARDQAKTRYMLALDAFNDMVIGIQEKLESRPGTLELRQDLLKNARKGLQKLLAEADKQGNPDLTLYAAHTRMGDVEILLGNIEGARVEFLVGHELALILAAADPTSAQAQGHLSTSFERLGDVTLQLGHNEAALDFYQKGLAISERRAAADPKNAQVQSDLSASFGKLGDFNLQIGQIKAALDFYLKDLAISERMAAAVPNDAHAQRGLSRSFDRLGDVSLQLGQTKEAFDFYQQGLAISERLAAADPKNAVVQRGLSLSFDRLGDVALRLDQTKAALEFYQKGLAISERLATADPKNAQFQRDLSFCFNGLGEVSQRLGQTKAALDFYQKGLAIIERRAAADPKDAQTQRDLSASFDNLGDVSQQLGQNQQTLDFYKKGLAIREHRAAADPTDAGAQTELFVSCYKLGLTEKKLYRYEEAGEWYGRGRAVLLPLHDKKLLEGPFKNAVADMDRQIAFCRTADKALTDLDFALKQPPAAARDLLDIRVRAFAKKNDPKNLLTTVEAYTKLAETDDRLLYKAACGWSIACGLAKDDAKLKEGYAGKAIALLQKIHTGKGHVFDSPGDLAANIKQDKDLDPLRERENFKKLVAELEKAVPTDGKKSN